MKSTVAKAISLSAALFCAHSSASVITLDTRGIDSGLSSDLQSSFYSQNSSITQQSLSEFNQDYIGNNSIAHLSVSFDSSSNGSWLFDMGLDAGYGAELYFNNVLVEKRTDDLWWRYDWNNSDVLSAGADVFEGSNTLDLFWAENCCNGYSAGRFSTNGGASWMDLTVANLDQVAEVSEPEAFAMVALGLLGLAGIRQLGANEQA